MRAVSRTVIRRRAGWSLVVASLALLLHLVVATPVSAHERRAIAGGKAEVVVGWLTEPAFVNEPNGIDFRVTNPTTKAPIEGLEKLVKVEVIQGAARRTFELRTRFGQPGAYTSDIVPTVTGDYSFRFTGEIDGVSIDEKFDSGPNRFDGIRAPTSIQFPTTQLTVGELQSSLAEARAAADLARLLAIGGLAVGLIGLAVGALALVGRGRRSTGSGV